MSLAFLSEHATQMGRSDSYSCVGFPQCMQGSAVPITGPLSFTSHPETFFGTERILRAPEPRPL